MGGKRILDTRRWRVWVSAFAAAGWLCVGPVRGQTVSTVEFSQPHTLDGLFVSRDGVLYGAGAWNSDELIRIGTDGTVEVVATGLRGPIHGVEDGEGRLWISNFTDGSVSRIDPTRGSVETVATGLDGPAGMAIDAAGRVYVANWGGAGSGGTVIHRILPDGAMEEWVRGRGIHTPIGLAFDDAGVLYVSNALDGVIHRVDPDTGRIDILVEAPQSGSPRPSLGHMVHHDGHLYVSGNFRHVIYDVDIATGEISVLVGSDNEAGRKDGTGLEALLTVPNGLALSPDGRTLWVGEGGAGLDQGIRRIDLSPGR